MKIGIICPSEIAHRRFLPALKKDSSFEFVGLGISSAEENNGKTVPGQKEKATEMIEAYGGKIFSSYRELISSTEIEAVYIPLPPALHYKWAYEALKYGKHVLIEKPSTTLLKDTDSLINLAEEKQLALHENYMFVFHKQIDEINTILQSGEIGEIRLYRISFGFPMRAINDFRYNKKLGGGALIDAGGYTLKLAAMLLGKEANITTAQSNYLKQFEVDMYGSATLVNNEGVTAQVSFGMDNNYKCELEVWGSKGTLYTNRILTAPVGYIPEISINKNNVIENRKLSEDDSFYNSLQYFKKCILDVDVRNQSYKNIHNQAKLVEDFKRLSGDF